MRDMSCFQNTFMLMGRVNLRDKTMNNKLMYIPNNDKNCFSPTDKDYGLKGLKTSLESIN